MHFLVGYRTDKYVILASDKSAFAFGALSVSQGKLSSSFLFFSGLRHINNIFLFRCQQGVPIGRQTLHDRHR